MKYLKKYKLFEGKDLGDILVGDYHMLNNFKKYINDGGTLDTYRSDEDLYMPHFFEMVQYPEVLKLALEYNLDLTLLDNNDNNILIFMCDNNIKTEIVEIIIETQIDINHQNIDGDTALFFAIDNNNIDTVKLLLEHGANPNIKDIDGVSPTLYSIHEIYYKANPEIIKLLLDAGGDINQKDKDGDSFLSVITKYNDGVDTGNEDGFKNRVAPALKDCCSDLYNKWMKEIKKTDFNL